VIDVVAWKYPDKTQDYIVNEVVEVIENNPEAQRLINEEFKSAMGEDFELREQYRKMW
jgi:methylphosphotriester-DNA--protein-cysteine methyltransferase